VEAQISAIALVLFRFAARITAFDGAGIRGWPFSSLVCDGGGGGGGGGGSGAIGG